MSHIDWKKVDAEVRHLYALPLYTLLVAHNYQIMIGEINNKQTKN